MTLKRVLKHPKAIAAGLTSQLLLLPAATCLVAYFLDPMPSIALGMVLVAACPGGNFSNFLSALAGGNTALSISMTTVVTTFAFLTTPLNFVFWSSLLPSTEALRQSISLDPIELLYTVGLIIIVPSFAGIAVSTKAPGVAAKMRKPFRVISIVLLFVFILGAVLANREAFAQFISMVVTLVIAHNAFALALGYTVGKAVGLPQRDRRTLAIETGIQNSGLGLVLIFSFFNGLGGMALVAAAWGIWHLVSGSALAFYWSRNPVDDGDNDGPVVAATQA